MFYAYGIEESLDSLAYVRKEQVSLAGNTSGLIVQYLRRVIPNGQGEPWKWEADSAALLKLLYPDGSAKALVIDAKPGKEKEETLIFQVLRIWGYSANAWTPVLLKLRLLSEGGKGFDLARFVPDRRDEVFTILHMAGSVREGDFIGPWIWPSVSATNSTFLWPEVLDYFAQKMGYTREA